MRTEVKQQLYAEAHKLAEIFSNPKREYNANNETFRVDKITPMSEYAAVIVFKKSSGLYALMSAFYVKDRWFTFFPTDSHLEGMRHMPDAKQKIEQANFETKPQAPPQVEYENVPYQHGREFD